MVANLIVLDTNVLIDLLEATPRGQEAKRLLESMDASTVIGYSLITRFELLATPEVARHQQAHTLLETLTPIGLSQPIIDRAAELFVSRYSRQRRKIPDALIAATAIESGAALLTFDRIDFANIPGLSVLRS